MTKRLATILFALSTVSLLLVADSASAITVPRIDINIEGNKIVIDRETYLNATIQITGNGYCSSLEPTAMKIKGRGNSSWHTPRVIISPNGSHTPTYNPKNPYRLKFDKKLSLAGMPKGKNWVLLANGNSGSLLTNAYGMAVARIVGTLAANHIVPVELYINGDYRGNYNLTEKVGISANSINIKDEDTAVLLELDINFDEKHKFYDFNYPSLPVMIKDPDLDADDTQLTCDQISSSFASLTAAIKRRDDMSSLLDTAMLARYIYANALICNQELLHPKSMYIFRERLNDHSSKWIFGPMWDLDWGYGYDKNNKYAAVSSDFDFWHDYDHTDYLPDAISFWNDLRANPVVKEAYARECVKFTTQGGLDSLLAYCKSYYELVKPSIEHDYEKWHWAGDGYDVISQRMMSWLSNRARYLTATAGVEQVGATHAGGKAPTGVYNILGQRVGNELSPNLTHGIYIVNGKKVVVR